MSIWLASNGESSKQTDVISKAYFLALKATLPNSFSRVKVFLHSIFV